MTSRARQGAAASRAHSKAFDALSVEIEGGDHFSVPNDGAARGDGLTMFRPRAGLIVDGSSARRHKDQLLKLTEPSRLAFRQAQIKIAPPEIGLEDREFGKSFWSESFRFDLPKV
jgi:hypothetical protein